MWTYGAASGWVVELCEAAELLGTSERHSRRPRKRYEAADAEGPDRSVGVGAPRGGQAGR